MRVAIFDTYENVNPKPENFIQMVPDKSSNSNMINAAACNLFKLKEKIVASTTRESSSNSANSDNGKSAAAASAPLPIVIRPEIVLSDHSLVTVYCFIKNFIG